MKGKHIKPDVAMKPENRLMIPRRIALMLVVFLVQAALNVGYFVFVKSQGAFGIVSVLIPIGGYSIILYRLPAFKNQPIISRVLSAIAASVVIWFVAGGVIVAAIIRAGLV